MNLSGTTKKGIEHVEQEQPCDGVIITRSTKSPPVAAPFIQRPHIKLLPTINCNNLHALVPEFAADGQARRAIDGAIIFAEMLH